MDGPRISARSTVLSWLHRAEQCEDEDGRFIFLWIAFNAAYAQDLAEPIRPGTRKVAGIYQQANRAGQRGNALQPIVGRVLASFAYSE